MEKLLGTKERNMSSNAGPLAGSMVKVATQIIKIFQTKI